jgi:hypothetical protein
MIGFSEAPLSPQTLATAFVNSAPFGEARTGLFCDVAVGGNVYAGWRSLNLMRPHLRHVDRLTPQPASACSSSRNRPFAAPSRRRAFPTSQDHRSSRPCPVRSSRCRWNEGYFRPDVISRRAARTRRGRTAAVQTGRASSFRSHHDAPQSSAHHPRFVDHRRSRSGAGKGSTVHTLWRTPDPMDRSGGRGRHLRGVPIYRSSIMTELGS